MVWKVLIVVSTAAVCAAALMICQRQSRVPGVIGAMVGFAAVFVVMVMQLPGSALGTWAVGGPGLFLGLAAMAGSVWPRATGWALMISAVVLTIVALGLLIRYAPEDDQVGLAAGLAFWFVLVPLFVFGAALRKTADQPSSGTRV